MASMYDMVLVNGTPRWRKDKIFVKKENVPDNVLEALTQDNVVDENGLVIVDTKGDELNKVEDDSEEKSEPSEDDQAVSEDEKSEEDPDAPEDDDKAEDETTAPVKKPAGKSKAKPAAPPQKFVSRVPQSHPGMGFPRKNGKTVDIFDLETPHTHIKHVSGHMVPLSTDSFNVKTDKQIEQRLEELGIEPRNLDMYSRSGTEQPVNDLDDQGDGLTDEKL